MRHAVASGAVALVLVGCGLDSGGLTSGTGDASSVIMAERDTGTGHLVDARTGDARTEDGKKPPDARDGNAADAHREDANALDAAPPRDVAEEPSPPAPCSIPPGPCVSTLPPGWTLVVYATSQTAPCPSGFTADAVVSSPEPQTGACGCTCNVLTAPSCDEGTLTRMVSTNGQCNQTGQPVTVAGPGCTPWASGSGGLAPDSQSTALPLTDGTCSASPAPDPSFVTTQAGLVCTPPTQCEEQLCEGTAPEGFTLCVSQPGAGGVCPAGWQAPVVVGDTVDLTCSACTCDINTQSTCTDAAIDFYKDAACTMLDTTVPITGACMAEPGAGDMPAALKYRATLTQVCATAGPETPTVALTSTQTICCQFD